MKIQKATFTNFKRLANQEFTCNPGLNVFVGANNSGKTSILQGIGALLGIYTLPTEKLLSYHLQGNGIANVQLQFLPKLDEFKKLIEIWSSSNARFSVLLEEQNEMLLQQLIPIQNETIYKDFNVLGNKRTIPPEFYNSLRDKTGIKELVAQTTSDFYSMMQSIVNNSLDNSLGPLLFLTSNNLAQQKEPFQSEQQVLSNRSTNNIRSKLFYLKQNSPKEYEEVKAQILSIFPEIKDIDVELNYKNGMFEFILRENIAVNGHSIEISYDIYDVGLGMQDLLAIAASIFLLKPSVVLMDEPDVHMHPALVRDFVRILKQLSKQTQFFITTHNIAFIDALAPEDLFTVVYRPEEKGSIIRSVTERDEVIEAAEMLGISVTNSILSGKPKVYVFVEGESDSAYLLHFAKRLGYAKSVNAFNVQFVPMGGKGTRFNMLRLIEKLGMNETPVVMVLDHDETSEEEIQTLREKHFNKYPERLVYWSRRQIENYICMPSAIQKLLQAPPQANKYASEIQGLNIEALVQELADKQLEAALKRFLEHTVINYSLVRTQEIRNILKDLDISLPSDEYSQELASKMFAMMSKQFMKLGQHSTSIKTTFLEQWSIHEKRLAMCDGRQLLSDMRKEFQERGLYSSFSNDEIIAFCNSEDIHADIRELLSQLHIMVTTF